MAEGTRYSALVCDAAEFPRSVLVQILSGAGYRVVGEAATAREAVGGFRSLQPDFLTIDVLMPEIGGIDVIRQIVGEQPDARILVCSAIGQQALVTEALEAGARDFVAKPFHPARVLEAVHRILG